jgi:uncharacterized protein (DUF58 family)
VTSTAAHSRFLDLRALASVAGMRFTTKQRIEGAYSGRHVSRQTGGSGEFADFREYSPGEDLRRLDWKVYARTGKSYIRLYQDETNLLCTLAIDVSGSMTFGSESLSSGSSTSSGGSKLEFAQYLATGLSHVISQTQDHVGVASLGERLYEFVAPGGTSSHATRVQEVIEQLSTHPAVTLSAGLNELFERSRTRGVLILFSDLLVDDLEEVFATLRLFRHRRFEIVLLHLVHPGEERLPEGSAFQFEGLENEGRVDCSPAEIRDAYEAAFARHLAAVRTMALAIGCDYRKISTAQPWMSVLQSFLVDRTG